MKNIENIKRKVRETGSRSREMRIDGRKPKDSVFAGCFSFEESRTGRFENPEISAASGRRITLGAICPYLRLHLVGPRDKRGKLRIIKREQVWRCFGGGGGVKNISAFGRNVLIRKVTHTDFGIP